MPKYHITDRATAIQISQDKFDAVAPPEEPRPGFFYAVYGTLDGLYGAVEFEDGQPTDLETVDVLPEEFIEAIA